MKILFAGLDSGAILRSRSRHQTFLRRPPGWVVSFQGPADLRIPTVIYVVNSGQFREAYFIGPLPDDVCFPIVENINATGTASQQGGTYFNRNICDRLINVVAL